MHDLVIPRRFADAIERVAERRWTSPVAASLNEDGVSLATLREKRHTVARLLARDLAADRLPPTPGRMYFVETDGKRRRLFEFPVIETVIHDAVAEWLRERTAGVLSPTLYSYQHGLSYRNALRDFARYVRVQSAADTPVRRGTYVLRRDVRAYFDSIPVDAGADVWRTLANTTGTGHGCSLVWKLLERTVRPLLADGAGATYRLARGIATGSPVANVVANVYLASLDAEMAQVAGGFYARYGDDIVAAHYDASAARTMSDVLDRHLEAKGLEFSAAKTSDTFLTASGDVEFLGHRVGASGTVSLSRRKTRLLLADALTRAHHGAGRAGADRELRVGNAVRALNRLLDAHSPSAHPYARLLQTTVTDRSYLKWLDHELALVVMDAALGARSAVHLRRFPPRLLRARFGLRSVVVARNRAGRAK